MDILLPNNNTKILSPASIYNYAEDRRLLIPYSDGRYIGFINHDKEIVIKPIFTSIEGDCYTDKDYIIVERPAYKWQSRSYYGKVKYLKGIINYKGEEVFPCSYRRILPSLSNKSVFTLEDEYRGHCVKRADGLTIVPYGKYSWIDGFDMGLARVEIATMTNGRKDTDAKWGLINEKGIEVVPVEYDDIWKFYNDATLSINAYKGKKHITIHPYLLDTDYFTEEEKRNFMHDDSNDYSQSELYDLGYLED